MNPDRPFAPSKDSDQPGHLPSLIRDLVVCMDLAQILSYPSNAQHRLVGCPGRPVSLQGTCATLLCGSAQIAWPINLSCSGENLWSAL